MTNGVGGNLSGLLQPFNEQSPVNLIAMIAQLGQQNPAALAALLAKTGAQPPPVPPLVGGGGVGGLVGGQGGDVLGLPGAGVPAIGPEGGINAPGPVSPTPQLPISAPAPLPATAAPGGGDGTGRLERVLQAVSQLEVPPAPPLPRAPAAQVPRGGGPAPNPELLAQLFQLLQGGAAPAGIPTLGQLIAGKAGVPATPQVQF